MEPERGTTKFKWEHFIDPATKAASPQFDDLCRGLAKVIVRSMNKLRAAHELTHIAAPPSSRTPCRIIP